MRIAYLCNLYPAVSHSFVRREIEAVECAGHDAFRFSLRPARADLKDDGDLRELQRTEAALARGPLPALIATAILFVTRPLKTLAAGATAYRLSGPGLKAKLRHLAYFIEAGWLLRRLEPLRIAHLHAHFGTNPAAVATILRAWGGPPFSFTVHGPDEFDAPLSLAIAAKIEAATFVAAISRYGRSQLMRWCAPEHWHKIHVIRCGVDARFLDAPAPAVRAELNSFLCIARLSAQKGLPLLIAACDRLHKQGERFTVSIVGDGELRRSIEADIHRRGLEGVVTLAGVRSSGEIHDMLLEARALVLPSFAEGLPVVLMEALALGRPVITTAIAGIPELVDEECGWLIAPGSEGALVAAMKEALHASAGDLQAKGAVGRERVQRMHDASRNAASLIEAVKGSLIFDDLEPAAQPVQTITHDAHDVGEAAVDVEARRKPGV